MPESEALERVAQCPGCGCESARPWREAACPETPADVFTIVECVQCGLRYMNPRPRPEALAGYYQGGYYSYVASVVRPRSHVHKCRLARALKLLPPAEGWWPRALHGVARAICGPRVHWLLPAPRPRMRFVDIGCGAGHRLDLARELGWETYGVDLGTEGLPVAQRLGHDVAVADAAALPFAAGSCDYVNLAHTLEHTSDPLQTLRECRRVLRPAGILQVAVPNSDSWGSQRYGGRWRALDAPRHLFHFTARTLRLLAGRAGLRVLAVSALDDEWSLGESAAAAGESGPPRLDRLSRWALRRQGLGENLHLWFGPGSGPA